MPGIAAIPDAAANPSAEPPFQSVITPPAPRMIGTIGCKSHGFMIGSTITSAHPAATNR